MNITYDASAYELLKMFSELESHSSFDRYAPTWTPRLLKIKELLDTYKIPYRIKHYVVPGYEQRYFTNFYVSFNQDSEEDGLLFLAHHDINNERSQNCQDNTASICHLIAMMKTLKNAELSRPIHFAIVDSEEHVNIHCCGSQVLSEDIHKGEFGNIEVCINLELTGLGEHIWVSSFEKFPDNCEPIIKKINAHKVSTPYNDAYVLSMHGVPAMCIGILDDEDIQTATMRTGYPKIWGLCHNMEDTFDKISKEDMKLFHNTLLSLC
jgi:hypothetical protein